MAIVVVQVGQCGNQLGDELWRQLSIATDKGAVRSPFFTRDRLARCVLVDSEPKVVQAVQGRHADIMRKENTVCGNSGRGNHWALGYYGLSNPASKRNAEKALPHKPFQLTRDQRQDDNCVVRDALRAIYAETRRTKDAEEFEAILLLHSLAGGTGSGMTSLLIEKIRYYFIEPSPWGEGTTPVDELEEAARMREDGLDGMLMEKRRAMFLVSVSVAPQSVGEVATQGLNAAMTLRALRNVDAVILLRNDDCIRVQRDTAPGSGVQSRSASTKLAQGNTEDKLASSSSVTSLVNPCSTFTEVNEVFVTLLMPILLYGRGESPLCDLVLKCSPNHRKIHNILTVVPTPQRHYLRFKKSVILSRLYCVTGARIHLPGVHPDVPVGILHTDNSLRAENSVHTRGDVQVPKALLESFTGSPARRRSPASVLLQNMEGVLVMNEARELNASLLFPLLYMATMKAKVGAFMTTFVDAGMTVEQVQAAIRDAAERLADAEDV
ncbi:zeta tubulin [Trypanosoma vivax]|uniref:Putative zeta tubulin n=1 Tax=Trypanosoma vivax (strain Y486) TaxID=1055687 RepID=G0TR31_TRYVY|nr:putative zeta tubulin [Trypanosoma vivax]KAH8611349.1 zeta tubulin [Trypanosoma vivax]CCC46395.1 putative zeta tubulin [Trypanosoma vivax Y486]